jgi:hypothetical protein
MLVEILNTEENLSKIKFGNVFRKFSVFGELKEEFSSWTKV